RPNDGTDPTGFFNIEFHIQLHPEEKWTTKLSKDELIEEMRAELQSYPGVVFGFRDRKSTRLNSSHVKISYAVFCLKKKNTNHMWARFCLLALVSYHVGQGLQRVTYGRVETGHRTAALRFHRHD